MKPPPDKECEKSLPLDAALAINEEPVCARGIEWVVSPRTIPYVSGNQGFLVARVARYPADSVVEAFINRVSQ